MKALLVPVMLCIGWTAGLAADGDFVDARWRGSFLNRRTGGVVAMLRSADGDVRAEITDDPAADLADLLHNRGRGWTAVVSADGGGTRNAWGERWRPLEPELAALLLLAGAELVRPAAAPAAGPWRMRRGAGTGRRTSVADPESAGLRRRLTGRARGRGGAGETLSFSAPRADQLAVTSTRRPGTLLLTGIRRRSIPDLDAEAFVPLWPLADFMTPANGKPGTSGTWER